MIVWGNFDGPEHTVMVGYFGGPQDPEWWPYAGEIDTSDQRYHDWYNSRIPGTTDGLPLPD